MNDTQRNVLRRCHVDLVRDLEPRFILDVLYQDGILTDNDIELIQAENSARGRCQVLLSMLPTRGPSAYGSFQKALLKTNYMHLGDILAKIDEEESKGNVKQSLTDNTNDETRTKDSQVETESVKKTKSDKRSALCGACKKFLESKLAPISKETVFMKVVKKLCCILMHNIEPRELIDEFYQEFLLSDDQCERVRTGITRRDRCEIFFEELFSDNSDKVIAVLVKTLRKKYIYIVSEIETVLKQTQMPGRNTNLSVSEKLQVLTKLREIENDTEVKTAENSKPFEGEHILAEQDTQSNHKLKQNIDDLNTMNTYKHKIIVNFDEFSDLSSSYDYVTHTSVKQKEISNVNDVRETRPKEYFEVDELETPIVKSRSAYENGIEPRQIHTNADKWVHKSVEQKTCISDMSCSCNTCHLAENTDRSLEEFSWTLAQQKAHEHVKSFDRGKNITTSDEYLDEPDGMLILNAHANNGKIRIGLPKELSGKTAEDTFESKSHFPKKTKYKSRKKAKNDIPNLSEFSQSNELPTDANNTVPGSKSTVTDAANTMKNSLQLISLGSSSPREPSKRLSFAFNHLSTLINEGNYEKFEFLSQRLQERFPTDYDMLCIVGYLKTSRDLFLTDFDAAKQKINATMELVPKTSNPRYFTLELFTSKSRMYITQKKLEKLQSTLDDAMMILETDPVGCSGRAAGWLYINDARNQTAKLSVLNMSKPNALKLYEQLFERAKSSFKRSMINFKNDGGKDGPFGFGYALCRLVILLLRCGDNGMTMNTLTPSSEDIDAAEQYIKNLEDSEIAMAKILEMHFRLAKCDYYFRRGNTIRALEHAETAYNIASELKLLEFTEHAHNRLKFLRSRTKLKVEEVTEEEVNAILFGESTETISSQSD